MLLKITLSAIFISFTRAQPYYNNYHIDYVNVIACTMDADCDPYQGAGFNCYNATYKQARSPVLTGGF